MEVMERQSGRKRGRAGGDGGGGGCRGRGRRGHPFYYRRRAGVDEEGGGDAAKGNGGGGAGGGGSSDGGGGRGGRSRSYSSAGQGHQGGNGEEERPRGGAAGSGDGSGQEAQPHRSGEAESSGGGGDRGAGSSGGGGHGGAGGGGDRGAGSSGGGGHGGAGGGGSGGAGGGNGGAGVMVNWAAVEAIPTIPYTRPPPLDRQARNYTVLNLNGTPTELKNRWRKCVLDYRLWCYNTSDRRYDFGGMHQRCCTLPPVGHFVVYQHYNGKWLAAVIDGPSGYLDGYVTRSVGNKKDLRVFEHSGKKGTVKPKFIESAVELPWDGRYKTADEALCGNLLASFLIMYRHIEGELPKPTSDEVIQAGETFILHFAESGRNDTLYMGVIHRYFRAKYAVGSKLIDDARVWKKSCSVIYNAIGVTEEDFIAGPKGRYAKATRTTTTPEIARDAEKILKRIRLLHRPVHRHGFFLLKDMPVHLSKEGPMDTEWAEKELQTSCNPDFANTNWGFLMEPFPAFPEN